MKTVLRFKNSLEFFRVKDVITGDTLEIIGNPPGEDYVIKNFGVVERRRRKATKKVLKLWMKEQKEKRKS